jgi:hypothetical protein
VGVGNLKVADEDRTKIALAADAVRLELLDWVTPRREVVPSLLQRLRALGPWPVRAITRGVTTASLPL